MSILLVLTLLSHTGPYLSEIGLTAQQQPTQLLDSLYYIDLEALGASSYCYGVGFDGEWLSPGRLWVTDGASQAGGANQIHIINLNGTLEATVEQSGSTGSGLYDLCCDYSGYIYGSDDNQIDYYSLNGIKQGSFTCNAANPNRALAHDFTYFYVGNLTNQVFQVVWDGVSGSTATFIEWSTAVSNGGVSGAAYDGFNDCLWITTASADSKLYMLDMDGSLINEFTYGIPTAYGCTTGPLVWCPVQSDRALWVLDPNPPCALYALELQPPGALERKTWGAIKVLF